MRASNLYAPTLRNTPAEAEIISHQLMYRAGMIRKVAGGMYTFLPLGWRVIRKIEQIKQDIAANKVQSAQAQKQLAEIDANTAYLKKSLADVRSKQQEWTKVAAAERNNGARTDTLDAEIGKMQKQIAQLESEIDQLYQQRSSIRLG